MISFNRTTTFSLTDSPLAEEDAFVVWWYGPLLRGRRAETVPKAVIFLRRLNKGGDLGEIVQREAPLTHLGLLRIGSVWRNGISKSIIDYPVRDFEISCSSGGWRSYSPRGQMAATPASFTSAEYPLRYFPDRNFLLEFHLSDGGRLLIPSMEFYVRCYGRSAEIKRVLATYRWGLASERLFKPFEGPIEPGTWPVRLAKRMRDDDAVFIAHVLYVPFARNAAKNIYSQIEASFDGGGRYAFLDAGPWFEGPAKIRVAGIPVDEGRAFLGLRILGMSHPPGSTILLDRENAGRSEAVDAAESEADEEGGYPLRVMRQAPDPVDLTDDDEPDHGASSLDIQEDDFKTLGTPRAVIRVQRSGSGRRPWRAVVEDESTRWATGEPYGGAKGVGYGAIHARTALESEGILRDMWNACAYLQASNPHIVQSSEWFTFEDGFKSDAEPRLIAFEPFGDSDTVSAAIRNWPFYDAERSQLRGALVIRLRVDSREIFLFEVQRKPLARRNCAGEGGEEAFKGLAFVLDDGADFGRWLRWLLARVRLAKGIVQQVVGGCPGVAHTFKHVPATSEKTPGEAAVRNALRKFGVRV